MDTSYLQVYKVNLIFVKVLLTLSVILILFGLFGILSILFFKNQLIPSLNIWNYVTPLFLGLLYIGIGWNALKSKKYYVSWNDSEISYILPKNKELELIKIQEIISIEKRNHLILIELNNNDKKQFNLNHFYFPERKKIIDLFEEIKQNLKSKQSIAESD